MLFGDILYRGDIVDYMALENGEILGTEAGDIITTETGSDTELEENRKIPNTYNVTSIANNTFGNEPHIHLGGS